VKRPSAKVKRRKAKPRPSRALADDPCKAPPKPAHRTLARPNEDFFLALDFHLREGERYRAKTVATRWLRTDREVRRIASRWRLRCAEVLATLDRDKARIVVQMHLNRVLWVPGAP
jgi:hypothetical protein